MRDTPRRFSTTAWISSKTTVSTVAKAWRPLAVLRMRARLSGVVMSSSGGWRSIRWRSPAGVSPLRVCARMLGNGSPRRSKSRLSSPKGCARLRRMSLFSALSGET